MKLYPLRIFIVAVGMVAWACWITFAFVADADENKLPPQRTAGNFFEQTVTTAEGGNVLLSSLRGEKATVVVFLSTECPISNGYVPTLNNLAPTYGSQGIKMVGLNPNAGQSLRQLQLHVRDFAIIFPCVKDVGGQIAEKLGVKTCPEVCVINQAGDVVYQGRIDDRYSRRGGAAANTHSPDLENALRDVAAGKAVRQPTTVAIGCSINPDAKKKNGTALTTNAPTYTRDIAPLLQSHCQECHRSGGIGPFSLQDFSQAQNWAEDIKVFTSNRTMPPWKASHDSQQFLNQRSLTKDQIAMIAAWVDGGCPEGEARDLPPPKQFVAGWRLGEPDFILESAEDYTLAADGPDDYRCFVLPTDFAENRFVAATSVLPGNPRIVHHVLIFLDSTGEAERLDAAAPGPGYSTSGGSPGFLPSGGLGGWAPGNTRGRFPTGMARILPKGARVVMQVHYHKTGKVEKDRTKLGIYFSKEPVNRAVFGVGLLPPNGPRGEFKIPAGQDNYEAKCALVMPKDLVALSITPHMHLLGKDMRVKATFPDGRVQNLIEVEGWDFNWQETYQYAEPLSLPRGTRLDLVAHFDNSTANVNNPHRPPQTVSWGPNTKDEMCIAFFELTTRDKVQHASELHETTPQERLEFILEARRLAGEPSGMPDPKWIRSFLPTKPFSFPIPAPEKESPPKDKE